MVTAALGLQLATHSGGLLRELEQSVRRMELILCLARLKNMLSLFNPYPDKFTDPMAGIYGNYPNLRRITLGINVSF